MKFRKLIIKELSKSDIGKPVLREDKFDPEILIIVDFTKYGIELFAAGSRTTLLSKGENLKFIEI